MTNKSNSTFVLINNILQKLDETDPSVLMLKKLFASIENGKTFYFLRYKGQDMTYYINYHGADFSNEITYYLHIDKTDPIWVTEDLITAVYAKYISTEWYNSSLETPTHSGKYNPEDIEVVDNYGRIYNRKLLTNKTIAILYSKILNDQGLVRNLKDEQWCNQYWQSLYTQKFFLQELKRKIAVMQNKIPMKNLSLDELYKLRKSLVQDKCKKLRENKSYKAIQNKLNKINLQITQLGGK